MNVRPLRRPRAVLFDLFHTLVSVPEPGESGLRGQADILGACPIEWQRLHHDEDVLGRCVGRITDPLEIMRRTAALLSCEPSEAALAEALDSKRRRFRAGLVDVEPGFLAALDALRASGIRTALVSDAGADDVEAWEDSPLRPRFDAVAFSYVLKARKPDPAIYRHALQALGICAVDTYFVGDGGSDEHRGARAVGCTPVLVTRLLTRRHPHLVAERSRLVHHVFEDVPAFVGALEGGGESREPEAREVSPFRARTGG